MTIKRNDPCVCGSGKKYKKCCMNKETVKVVAEQQREHYIAKRKQVIEKLRMYVKETFTVKERFMLEKEFDERSNHAVPKELKASFTELWLLFFNKSSKGRLITAFLEERKDLLTAEEYEMIQKWSTLTPRLVQAVDRKESKVTFKDRFNDDVYTMTLTDEGERSFAPWYGTFSLIEDLNQESIFYGVRMFEGPLNLEEAATYVKERAKQTKETVDTLLVNEFPEILSAFIKGQQNEDSNKMKIVKQFKAQWKVENENELITYLEKQPSIYLENWSEKEKMASFILDWYRYTDSEMSGDVLTTEVKSTLKVQDNIVEVEAFDSDSMNKVKNNLNGLTSVSFMNEGTKEWEIPYHAEMKNMLVQMNPELPKHFSLFAQNNIEAQLDKPYSTEEKRTIKELVRADEIEKVEGWLRQSEYNVYIAQKNKLGQVEVTADYNTLREELNLPMSPFVTGGRKRVTKHEHIPTDLDQSEAADGEKAKQEGQALDDAYDEKTAVDLYLELETFKEEKTNGKSDATVRKYSNSVEIFAGLLNAMDIKTWSELTKEKWEALLCSKLKETYSTLSKTQSKDFVSVLRAFVKWQDKKEGTSVIEWVTPLLKEVESMYVKQPAAAR
ncbi:SEC-C metal-binding domain-containing protein [Alkalihalophilus pseudofirmus]|uniref:SEC-C metal-binding domain-containing protein n=1 Tax=Alkalihalophilus pseudofirmus TaxID=79885 RepID=A0AAJ2L0S2_ALKPS|nr:SEC-C metal-binding domain-containing protein [Alkalihalophilus pseudofirmus]MDV2884430.1 SEC-C metal-binding domain-containing protein [Alkalihalophilus pseudofirmus]